MPLQAVSSLRRMRGGAQAQLIEASDGHFYIVKFRNNPQHRRILINELVTSTLLDYLGIPAAPTAVIQLDDLFLAAHPHIQLTAGRQTYPPNTGWHFASRFPGHPDRTVVYDYLPDALLQRLPSFDPFLGILAVDKWIGNADSRQAIFVPPPADDPAATMQVLMIDHGFAFNGPHWQLGDMPAQGLYFRPTVYRDVRALADFDPWLSRIAAMSDDVLDDALRRIPQEWFENDEEELHALLAKLHLRRHRVGDFILATRNARASFFPAW